MYVYLLPPLLHERRLEKIDKIFARAREKGKKGKESGEKNT